MSDTSLAGIDVTEVTASFSATINIGNFENLKPEISITATVGEGQDPHEVQKTLSKYARAEVDEIKKYINKVLES